jgi:hydroxymethylpyrimidine pyrophosphatase-like HAD family hydrolase
MHFFDSAYLYTPNREISPYTVHESYVTKVPLRFRTIEEIPKDLLAPKAMYIDEPEKLDRTIAAIPEDVKERYTMVKSSPFFYEILHPAASKGNAVQQLAVIFGIAQEEVICIGDNGNDMSMIETGGMRSRHGECDP